MTNTGKTHLAIERMLGHPTGMIGLPLRLLAREVYHGEGVAAVAVGPELDLVDADEIDLVVPRHRLGGADAPPPVAAEFCRQPQALAPAPPQRHRGVLGRGGLKATWSTSRLSPIPTASVATR
jgi:hypothetical protein